MVRMVARMANLFSEFSTESQMFFHIAKETHSAFLYSLEAIAIPCGMAPRE